MATAENRIIDYDPSGLKQAEELYSKVELSEFQREKMVMMAKLANKYLNMSEVALRGFFVMGVKEAQQKHHFTMDQLPSMSVEGRIDAYGKVTFAVEGRIKKILKKKEDETNLSKAFDELRKFYATNIAPNYGK